MKATRPIQLSGVLAVQIALSIAVVYYQRTTHALLTEVLFDLSLLFSFVAYIAILHRAPAFRDMGRIVRTACLTLLSITATFSGSFGTALLLALLGFPVRA
jgi:hypothetical protein